MRNFKLLSSVLTLLFLLTTAPQIQAQSRVEHPKWEVRAGIGLLPTFLKDHTKSELQPISLEIRYRPVQKFSLGLLVGNSIGQAMQEHHTGEKRLVRNDFRLVGVRGAIHNNYFDKWDIYGGITLGYSKSKVDYLSEEEKGYEPSFFPKARVRNGLFFSGFVGANYAVYKNVNLFGELGMGLSLATAGVSVKF
jgi:hypothetical protein